MDRDTEGKQLRRIVVALDGSQLAEHVLPYVRSLATQFDSTVTLIEVVPPLVMPIRDHWHYDFAPAIDALHQDALDYLSEVAGRLRDAGLTVEYEAPMGEPATTVVGRAGELGADLIAMTTIGRTGMGRVIFGSVADKVLKIASVPILLIRTGD
jgi:nucleotide-binding universal stress UspA family protein